VPNDVHRAARNPGRGRAMVRSWFAKYVVGGAEGQG
jgi:hypothetical protein